MLWEFWQRRCVVSFGPWNRPRCSKTLIPMLWKCFTECLVNLQHMFHSFRQKTIYHWSSAPMAGKGDKTDSWSSGTTFAKQNAAFLLRGYFCQPFANQEEGEVTVLYEKWTSIILVVQRVMEAWTAVNEWGSLESGESVVQPFLYNDWNLESFQVLANQDDDWSPLKHPNSINCFQKADVIQTSSPSDVCKRPESLHFGLQSLTKFIMETLDKRLRDILLYNDVNTNVLKMHALKN